MNIFRLFFPFTSTCFMLVQHIHAQKPRCNSCSSIRAINSNREFRVYSFGLCMRFFCAIFISTAKSQYQLDVVSHQTHSYRYEYFMKFARHTSETSINLSRSTMCKGIRVIFCLFRQCSRNMISFWYVEQYNRIVRLSCLLH